MIENDSTCIAEFTPKDLARQLCAIEFRLFKQIRLHDLVDKRFEKGLSSALNECSKWFDILGAYLTSCILLTGKVASRTALINRFISIAHKCVELKNYNTAMSLFSALQNPGIQRLKATWRDVSMKALSQYQELNQVFSVDSNFRYYRNLLKNSNPPCIPVLSLVQHDLIFIEEANEKFLSSDKKIINFERCYLLYKAIIDIFTFQQSQYSFMEIKDFHIEFTKITRLDSKVLYNLSNLLEPRETVKHIPAPVLSKRKQIIEFKNSFRDNDKKLAAERAAKELTENNTPSFPSTPSKAVPSPLRPINSSKNNDTAAPIPIPSSISSTDDSSPRTPPRTLIRSRSFSANSISPEVRDTIEKLKSEKNNTGSYIAPNPKKSKSKSKDIASTDESTTTTITRTRSPTLSQSSAANLSAESKLAKKLNKKTSSASPLNQEKYNSKRSNSVNTSTENSSPPKKSLSKLRTYESERSPAAAFRSSSNDETISITKKKKKPKPIRQQSTLGRSNPIKSPRKKSKVKSTARHNTIDEIIQTRDQLVHSEPSTISPRGPIPKIKVEPISANKRRGTGRVAVLKKSNSFGSSTNLPKMDEILAALKESP